MSRTILGPKSVRNFEKNSVGRNFDFFQDFQEMPYQAKIRASFYEKSESSSEILNPEKFFYCVFLIAKKH
jgi:hypothetical protein